MRRVTWSAVVGAEVDHSEIQVHVADACVPNLGSARGRMDRECIREGVGGLESVDQFL